MYLGYCYLNLGNYTEALERFYKCLAINRRDTEILKLAGLCNVFLFRPEVALEYYSRVIEVEPEQAGHHLQCAGLLMTLKNRQDDALQHLQAAKQTKTNPQINEIVHVYELVIADKKKEAIEEIKRLIPKLAPESGDIWLSGRPDFYHILSHLQREDGDLQGCIATLEKAVKEKPYDLEYVNLLAFEYAEQQIHLEQALILINRAIQTDPQNPYFWDTKGWILFKMGRLHEAKEAIEESLHYDPSSTEVQDHQKSILRALEENGPSQNEVVRE